MAIEDNPFVILELQPDDAENKIQAAINKKKSEWNNPTNPNRRAEFRQLKKKWVTSGKLDLLLEDKGECEKWRQHLRKEIDSMESDVGRWASLQNGSQIATEDLGAYLKRRKFHLYITIERAKVLASAKNKSVLDGDELSRSGGDSGMDEKTFLEIQKLCEIIGQEDIYTFLSDHSNTGKIAKNASVTTINNRCDETLEKLMHSNLSDSESRTDLARKIKGFLKNKSDLDAYKNRLQDMKYEDVYRVLDQYAARSTPVQPVVYYLALATGMKIHKNQDIVEMEKIIKKMIETRMQNRIDQLIECDNCFEQNAIRNLYCKCGEILHEAFKDSERKSSCSNCKEVVIREAENHCGYCGYQVST